MFDVRSAVRALVAARGFTSLAVLTAIFLCDALMVLSAGVAVGLVGAVGLGKVLRVNCTGLQPLAPTILARASTVFIACAWCDHAARAASGSGGSFSLILKEE